MTDKNSIKLQFLSLEILKKIEEEYREHQKFSDENLLVLYSLFGGVFERALEIISKNNSITVYTDDSNLRSIAEVKGHSEETYCLLIDINYCSCPAFQHQVLQKKSQLTCKHILALRIAKITGEFVKQVLTEKQYDILYCSIFSMDDD